MTLRYWPRWSLGHRAANFIFASGQPGVSNEGDVVAPGDASRQAWDALENVRRIIEAGGGWFTDVFKIRAFANFSEDYDAIVATVQKYVNSQFPAGDGPAISFAISPVGATRDRSLLLAEIEAFAATERTVVSASDLFSGHAQPYGQEGYAHAVRVGNLIFTGGFVGVDADGQLISSDPSEQAEQALGNLDAALDAAGVNGGDIVKLTTYVDSAETFRRAEGRWMSFVRNHFGDGPGPAATTMIVPPGLGGARLAVEAIAAEGAKETVVSTDVYHSADHGGFAAQAVKVPIASSEGSYLRRITWPTYPPDADRASIGLELERQHPLGHLVLLSSQAPLDVSGQLVSADPGAQAWKVFENIQCLAEAAGGSFSDVVQVDIYVDSAENYPDFNDARVRFSEACYPDKNWFCGSGVTGTSVIDGVHVEIEAIQAVG
jgi:2-iminobutanoate/2-iminopropanoate deaminase